MINHRDRVDRDDDMAKVTSRKQEEKNESSETESKNRHRFLLESMDERKCGTSYCFIVDAKGS